MKIILLAVLVGCGLWLAELYTDPTWAKIRSFLLGYFLGTFVMEWIRQRAERGDWSAAAATLEAEAAVGADTDDARQKRAAAESLEAPAVPLPAGRAVQQGE